MQRKPTRQNRYNIERDSAAREGRASADASVQKIRKIFMQEDGQEIPLDHTTELSEGMTYHEERMARKAAQTSQRQRDRSRSLREQSQQRRRGTSAETADKQDTQRIPTAQRTRSTSAQTSRQRTHGTSVQTSRQRTRRKGGRRLDIKKLLLAIGVAVLIIAAIVVALILIFSGAKEAANLKLTTTDTTQTLTWERKGKDSAYEVLQKTSDGSFQVVKTVSSEGGTSVTVEGLSPATLYEYKVCAFKDTSGHPKKTSGISIKGYTAPSVLTDLTAGTQIKESLTFVWSDPQPVAGFELRYGAAEDFSDAATVILTISNIVVDEGNGKNTYTIEDIPEGTKYYYSMRSFCDENSYSDWTPTATARVTRPVDMRGIDVNAPMVALTFDDGPDVSDITSRILDAFAAAGGHGTFFQLGERAEMYPEKIQRIVNEGHEIANHTYDHSHLGDAVTSEDIVRANDAIEEAGGVRPVSFRSPGGNTTELIRQTCIQENMALYYWSMDTRDWYTKDAAETVSYIKSHVSDGDIILMHNIYDSSAEAVEEILPWLVEQGYQLVTVSQLLVAKTGSLPEPGTEYSTATKTLDR